MGELGAGQLVHQGVEVGTGQVREQGVVQLVHQGVDGGTGQVREKRVD